MPIVQRELRVASRKAMTYYSRSIAGLVAACISLGIILVDFTGTIAAGSSGELVFHVLSALAYFFVCFEGALLTCDCLSAEKREGTLGLLFLTDLRGYDIIAGKLIPHASRTALYLIAAIPASAIAFILGGITGSDLLFMSIALANALFFSAAVGLLISSYCWHDRHAMVFGVGAVMILTMAIPSIEGFGLTSPGSLVVFGPAGAFIVALNIGTVTMPSSVYGTSLAVSQTIGWACIAVASYRLSRTIDGEPVKRTVRTGKNSAYRSLLAGGTEYGLLPATKADWAGAVFLPAIALVGFGIIRWVRPFTWMDIPMLMCLMAVIHLVLKFVVAGRACRVLVTSRQKGELEMLLTTPFDPQEILRGYALGIKRQSFPLVAGVLVVDLVMVVAACFKLRFYEGLGLAAVAAMECVWLFLNLYSLTWVGMFMSLRCRTSTLAMQWTLGLVLLAPWVAIFLTVGLLAVATRGAIFSGGSAVVQAIWALAIVLFANLGVTAWAVTEIYDKFRELASHQVIPPLVRPRWDYRLWVRRFLLLEK